MRKLILEMVYMNLVDI